MSADEIVAKNIPFLADAAEIVLTHHEGDGILLSSTTFAVADTLDAITSNRPYRRASSFELASETICASSGTQFDPRGVAAFVSIPEKTWPAFATNQQRVAALSSPYPGNLEILRKGLG